ncbi:nucleotidyltransferase [Bacteroidia bacterium]|nr:nucleotidyltransferase [Bacteroidia bacterium]
MKTRSEIISKLQEIKPVLQKEWAVETVGLFGSFADESNTASSDIDIMVEFNSSVGWRFFALEAYLEKELNHKIDLVTKNALKEQIKPGILNQMQYI